MVKEMKKETNGSEGQRLRLPDALSALYFTKQGERFEKKALHHFFLVMAQPPHPWNNYSGKQKETEDAGPLCHRFYRADKRGAGIIAVKCKQLLLKVDAADKLFSRDTASL